MHLPNTLRLMRLYKKGIIEQIQVISKHDQKGNWRGKTSDYEKAVQKLRDVNQELEYLEAL